MMHFIVPGCTSAKIGSDPVGALGVSDDGNENEGEVEVLDEYSK